MCGVGLGFCCCGDGVDLESEFLERGREVAPHEPSRKGNSILAFFFVLDCSAIFDCAFVLAARGGKDRLL